MAIHYNIMYYIDENKPTNEFWSPSVLEQTPNKQANRLTSTKINSYYRIW